MSQHRPEPDRPGQLCSSSGKSPDARDSGDPWAAPLGVAAPAFSPNERMPMLIPVSRCCLNCVAHLFPRGEVTAFQGQRLHDVPPGLDQIHIRGIPDASGRSDRSARHAHRLRCKATLLTAACRASRRSVHLRKSRGDWTPLELFLAGIRGSDAGLRRHFQINKSTCDW